MTPEGAARQRRNRDRVLESLERHLARRQGRDPRPLPKTDAEYREWRRPFVAEVERLREKWRAALDQSP